MEAVRVSNAGCTVGEGERRGEGVKGEEGQTSTRTQERQPGVSPAQRVPVLKVKAPPVVPQTAFAFNGLPLYPVVQESSDAPWTTETVHWPSPLLQAVPLLSVPAGSVQVFSAQFVKSLFCTHLLAGKTKCPFKLIIRCL